jgi:RNA polymerase sigma-70 factor, ECF subfamily
LWHAVPSQSRDLENRLGCCNQASESLPLSGGFGLLGGKVSPDLSHALNRWSHTATLAFMNSAISSIPDDCVSRFTEGDQQAFDELYTHYAPDVFAFLVTRLRNREEAEDVLQDTWVKVWNRRESYQDRSFSGWVFQIARTTLIDYARSAKRHRTEDVDTNEASSAAEGPVGEALRREQLRIFEDCLKEVGGPFIEVFLMVKVEDQPPDDVAAKLKIPRATIYTKISRAKQALADCVEGKFQ